MIFMSDVNYIEYGSNALRVFDSATDTATFLGANGEIVGTILVVVIILFLLALLFVAGYLFIFKPMLTLK